MKTLLILGTTFLIAAAAWFQQHRIRAAQESENARLGEALAAREQEADILRQDVERATERLEALRTQAAAVPAARLALIASPSPATPTFSPPDPARRGGWHPSEGFFYLPKEWLNQLGYSAMSNHRVTDEAAALFGLTRTERESVDNALRELLGQFRQAELAKMQAVTPPSSWVDGNSFELGQTYWIPDMSSEVDTLRQNFSRSLQGSLGPTRAGLFDQTIDAQLDAEVDNLGRGERIVGFLWQKEADGTRSLWYGIASGRQGEGSFQRVPTDVKPDSQIAYYASLFGVTLPASR